MPFAASPKVGFAVIGVQKAGTSALFHFLSQHPMVEAPARKELHFFDDEGHCWECPDYRRYHCAFPRGSRRLLGEATPSYIWWPQALERLWDYNPRLKVIALFRDPVARAHAHWRMSRARGVETLCFSRAIRDGRRRLEGAAPDAPALRHFSYVERGFYGAQVERLMDVFPRRQVLMLRQEDLAEAHDATLARAFRFLKLPPCVVPRRRVFEGARAAPPSADDLRHLRRTYADDLARFAALTALDVSEWSGKVSPAGDPSAA